VVSVSRSNGLIERLAAGVMGTEGEAALVNADDVMICYQLGLPPTHLFADALEVLPHNLLRLLPPLDKLVGPQHLPQISVVVQSIEQEL